MDYELVLDLTHAATQAYATNINQLLTAAIPSFSIHERDKFFTSIQLTCNLNTASLPKSTILPKLQDLHNTKPTNLGGTLIRIDVKKRASMNSFLQQQKAKNKNHRNFLQTNHRNHSHASSHSPTNNHNYKNKNKLVSSLPSPAYPISATANNQNHKEEATPPPTYSEIESSLSSLSNHTNDDNDEKCALIDDEKYAQELQQIYDEKPLNTQHQNKMDEDYALALRLQQEQNEQDEDMQIALRLQKEEKMKVEYARNRLNQYRRNSDDAIMNANLLSQEGTEFLANIRLITVYLMIAFRFSERAECAGVIAH